MSVSGMIDIDGCLKLELTSCRPGIDYSSKEGYALDGVSQKDAWLNGEDSNKREYLLYNYYYKVDIRPKYESFAPFFYTDVAPLAIR